MEALLVVDMQEAMRRGDPKHALADVVARIDRLAARVRARGGHVFFVQHTGEPGSDFEPRTPGWALLSELRRESADRIVAKTLNDAFFGTPLEEELRGLGVDRLLICGWATDMCVDATLRSAAARGFRVTAVEDAHTVSDRPHLSAERVIEHHHYVWANLICPHPVSFAREADL